MTFLTAVPAAGKASTYVQNNCTFFSLSASFFQTYLLLEM